MNPPSSVVSPPMPNLVEIAEPDLPELASFVAAQSAREPKGTLAHLTWLLLENPARHVDARVPLGCGLRSTGGALVGCILYLPQVFVFDQNPLLVLGSSCFYVDESHRGSGGALFLKFSRVGNQWPLFGNSANTISAQLWKARRATPIPNSDRELLGVTRWPSVAEEVFVGRGMGKSVARTFAAATSWMRYLRKLQFPLGQNCELVRLSSIEEVMELPLAESDSLTAQRDESYIRWRYFSQRDPTIALFSLRHRRSPKPVFVAVNERPRGHRGQIRSVNLLDAFPKPEPDVMLAIVAALHAKYRERIDMIVLRNLDEPCQKAMLQAGFHRRDFESPNGWILDRHRLLPTQNFYFVPADGDWII